jgi:hypothetical protein
VTDAPSNPNFTRSYGYTIEPTTHTGVQANYQVTESLAVAAAIADTYGPTINQRNFLVTNGHSAESYKTYMASVTFTAPTNWGVLGGSTLTGCIINGFNSGSVLNNGTVADQTSFYVGGTINTPVSGLKVGVAYDYAGVSGQPLTSTVSPHSGYANATGLYVSYQATEKLTLYGRGEYASSSGTGTASPFLASQIFETTFTAQYDLWKNVLSRVEFRWDHAADGTSPYGGTTTSSVGGKKNSYILLADVAYKF